MSSFMNPDDRLLDLLSAKATEGLNPEQQQELDRLLSETGMIDEPERFEISAAAFDLAVSKNADSDSATTLPDGLRDKVLMDAGQFFNQPSPTDAVSNADPGTGPLNLNQKRRIVRESLGWLVAAACILMGIWLWPNQPGGTTEPAPSLAMADFEGVKDRVSSDWVGVHQEDARGSVVWSDELQAGYMVFENLPVNDPSVEQYQLWIFDGDVAQEVPTDGGVFDITEEGTSTVFFRPTYPVKKGVQFAVTIEPPGGVQQSDRSRLPMLATIAQGETSENE